MELVHDNNTTQYAEMAAHQYAQHNITQVLILALYTRGSNEADSTPVLAEEADGLEEQEREGVAIGTPTRSERKGAADGAGWLGHCAVGSRRERGPHKHRGPHIRQRSSQTRSSVCF